jgi:UDP-N-acetylglucosamine--N-acetylmuramyl-(pentapeptide) pyrophosphoryl-undecaprenol N-acetylglucosamine transferase
METELVQREGVPFQAIPAAGLHGVGLPALPGNLGKVVRGFAAAREILEQFQPDVQLFTGGYVAVPMAAAGRLSPQRPGIVLYVPDIEPGLALKLLARIADRITVTADESRQYFPANAPVTTTGYPVRGDLQRWTRGRAFAEFDLDPAAPVLMVFGGSKGARSINQALAAGLGKLLTETQIIHVSGQLDWETARLAAERLPEHARQRYRLYPYLHERMGAAFTIADLVAARAGASTLGEFPAFGLPAVLIPYPHAWRYQKVNAQYLVDRRAAILLQDEELPDRLVPVVLELIRDPEQRARMQASMRGLARPQAADDIASELFALARTASRSVTDD